MAATQAAVAALIRHARPLSLTRIVLPAAQPGAASLPARWSRSFLNYDFCVVPLNGRV